MKLRKTQAWGNLEAQGEEALTRRGVNPDRLREQAKAGQQQARPTSKAKAKSNLAADEK